MPDLYPYTLWFHTLPSGDTAQVYIYPHGDEVYIVGHWNRRLRLVEAFQRC